MAIFLSWVLKNYCDQCAEKYGIEIDFEGDEESFLCGKCETKQFQKLKTAYEGI